MSTSTLLDFPLVSIVIPVYNGANFLASAIESALQQTYSRIEIIVVNDGSTDDGATALVAKSYKSRIRYFEKTNGGCGSALNFGIERMRGEYFSWLSHDDLYDPGKVDLQMRYARKHEADERFGAVCCAYRLWHMANNFKEPQKTFFATDFNRRKFYGLFRGAMNGNAMLIHRRVFNELGLFDPSLRTTQDYDFFYRMLKKYNVVYHDDILVTARIHPQQDTNAKQSINILESDRLWSTFIDESEPLRIDQSEPSRLLYWIKFANHLAYSPYPVARDKVFQRLYIAFETHKPQRKPKVSVIMPFTEIDNRMLAAAKSAFMQTYPCIEYIFAANRPVASKDMEKLRRLALIFNQTFEVVQADAQRGPSYARNRALERASGELIAFIDADDIWHPVKIERQAAFFDADTQLEVCSTAWIEEHLNPSSFYTIDWLYRNRPEFINVTRPTFPLSTIMIRSTTHRFDETLLANEDLMFVGGLMTSGKFAQIPMRLAAIHLREPHQLPADLDHDFCSRSLVWQTFSENDAISISFLDELRFAYIKGALDRFGKADVKFLFRQRHHIIRRIRQRPHTVRNISRYLSRRILSRRAT